MNRFFLAVTVWGRQGARDLVRRARGRCTRNRDETDDSPGQPV